MPRQYDPILGKPARTRQILQNLGIGSVAGLPVIEHSTITAAEPVGVTRQLTISLRDAAGNPCSHVAVSLWASTSPLGNPLFNDFRGTWTVDSGVILTDGALTENGTEFGTSSILSDTNGEIVLTVTITEESFIGLSLYLNCSLFNGTLVSPNIILNTRFLAVESNELQIIASAAEEYVITSEEYEWLTLDDPTEFQFSIDHVTDVYEELELPFGFTSFGVNTFNKIQVWQAGGIQLGDYNDPSGLDSNFIRGESFTLESCPTWLEPTPYTPPNFIAGVWSAYDAGVVTDWTVSYQVFGDTPNRYVVIQYEDMPSYTSESDGDDPIKRATFQIVLFEDGRIQINVASAVAGSTEEPYDGSYGWARGITNADASVALVYQESDRYQGYASNDLTESTILFTPTS